MQKDYVSFISAGIACNAMTIIKNIGILKLLSSQGVFHEKDLQDKEKYKNPIAIRAALLSLCCADVLSKTGASYSLTKLGKELANNIGLVTMLFDGYSELFANQVSLAKGEIPFDYKYINGESIAEASIQFSENTAEPLLLEIIQKLQPKGTICDLGCGSGAQLLKMCEMNKCSGLGFDYSKEAIKVNETLARRGISCRIEEKDITKLQGVWEEVDILSQSFVLHDVAPLERAVEVFRSYQENFPNMRYFINVDIVTPCNHFPSHMPGFDYVHGLQGIQTRNYAEMRELFERSEYDVVSEILVPNMPNTFLWVLAPKRIS